jgi:hypothetical protein
LYRDGVPGRGTGGTVCCLARRAQRRRTDRHRNDARASRGDGHAAARERTRARQFVLLPSAGAPAGVLLLVEDGTIRRVEVANPAVRTTDAFRVGDPRAKIRQFYGSRARVSPGKYDPDDQTLTIEPPAGGNPKFRLVFALRKGIVQTIYAGALPQVAYVEGCS